MPVLVNGNDEDDDDYDNQCDDNDGDCDDNHDDDDDHDDDYEQQGGKLMGVAAPHHSSAVDKRRELTIERLWNITEVMV